MWWLAADPAVSELHAAPGNPGIVSIAHVHAVSANSPADVVLVAKHVAADLVAIGPEAPLVVGVADALLELSASRSLGLMRLRLGSRVQRNHRSGTDISCRRRPELVSAEAEY